MMLEEDKTRCASGTSVLWLLVLSSIAVRTVENCSRVLDATLLPYAS